jgi:hypothetical protein
MMSSDEKIVLRCPGSISGTSHSRNICWYRTFGCSQRLRGVLVYYIRCVNPWEIKFKISEFYAISVDPGDGLFELGVLCENCRVSVSNKIRVNRVCICDTV